MLKSLNSMIGDNRNTLVAVGVCTGLGVGAYLAWKSLQHKKLENLRWEEVGHVGDLILHPVKSAGGFHVSEAEASSLGLKKGQCLDRSFMVVSDDLRMVTGREAGTLVTIKPKYEGNSLTLTDKNGDSVTLNTDEVVKNNELVKFNIRGDPVEGVDCGALVSDWLSARVFPDKRKLRLIYAGKHKWTRAKRTFPFAFPSYYEGDTTLYNDSSSYHVASKSSLEDLNARCSTSIPMEQFRPPIVVFGSRPFDEDTWLYIRIGHEVVLRMAKPCERCLLTTVAPNTGERKPEVLETLRTYRLPVEGTPAELLKAWSTKPIFGLQCGIDAVGKIKIGDVVEVVRQKPLVVIKNRSNA